MLPSHCPRAVWGRIALRLTHSLPGSPLLHGGQLRVSPALPPSPHGRAPLRRVTPRLTWWPEHHPWPSARSSGSSGVALRAPESSLGRNFGASDWESPLVSCWKPQGTVGAPGGVLSHCAQAVLPWDLRLCARLAFQGCVRCLGLCGGDPKAARPPLGAEFPPQTGVSSERCPGLELRCLGPRAPPP